jgi:hypothetical protein
MESINLNLIPERFSPIAHASQHDTGRVTRFRLYDGSVPFKLSGQESIKLRIRKTDGSIVTAPVNNTADNYVDIVTTEDITGTAGRVYCKLRIDDLGAKSFYYLVEPQP